MKIIVSQKAVLLILISISSTISKMNAQELNDFDPRYTNESIRGNLTMTANDIVGLVYKGGFLDPNAPYDVNNTVNGDNVTAYIDIDDDPTTFSSSSANLTVPRENCGTIVYAGLYWSANYYMARRDDPSFSDDNLLDSSVDMATRLIINNSPLAKDYNVRYSEFNNDNSDIKLRPVTSYLVVAQPENGCGITNGAALAGNIAVVRNGGSCSLREKVVNAEAAGALGVVIVDGSGNLRRLTGNGPAINIPAVSIGNDDISNGNFANGDLIPLLQAEPNVVLATLSTTGNGQLDNLPLTDPRKEGPADFRNIKFKVPNGNYVNLTAENIVWDGYSNTPTNNNSRANDEVQYVCYSDVTALIDPTNPFGMYTIADMNATQGYTSTADGACGGWMLVVAYEDPKESSKFISTQDGYVQIFPNSADVSFSFSGFRTLQGNQPVDVLFGVAALEGDKAFIGDQLLIETAPVESGNFIPLGEGTNNFTDINPTNNFFNSSITVNNNFITPRIPASENSLGFDADMFQLPNAGNNLIGNDQTSANFRIATSQDRYGVFFGAFSVTVIEPELRIIKRVYDVDGVTEITDQTVELGDELFYDLEIENIGNEDFVDETVIITDVLPANTNFISVVDATLPVGVTYSEIAPGVLEFRIDSDIVETPNDTPVGEGDGPIFIRFKVQLTANCQSFRNACSNIIQNTVTARYTGAVSGIEGNIASSAQLSSCGKGDNDSSNVFVNVSTCRQDVGFCDNDLTITAGTGYSQYTWSGPGIITPVVQTGTDAHVFTVGNPQTGVYMVIKEDIYVMDSSCMTLTEEFDVDLFRDIENPILDYVNGTTVITEDCDGVSIPQILLCGDQDLLLDTQFDPANLDNISWQRLSPSGACVLNPNDPCSLVSGDCTDTNWVEEPGGNTTTFTVSVAGNYRIMVELDGGCILPFYFSVFKNDYQPLLSMTPIECGNDGSVSVTNVPTNFAFSLTSGGPYTNTTGVFPISSSVDVTVYAIDTTFMGCEYTATINVPSINPTFEVVTVDPMCVNDENGEDTGSINIIVTDGLPEYQYTITSPALGAASPIIVPNSSANNGNYTLDNLPPGDYSVEVSSNRLTHECVEFFDVTINPAPAFDAEVLLLAPETCTGAMDGGVTIAISGGTAPYYTNSTNNDADFVINKITYTNLPSGITTIYVLDSNGCRTQTSVTILSPQLLETTFTVTSISNTENGTITINAIGGTGRYTYELYNEEQSLVTTSQESVFSITTAGVYTVKTIDANGCYSSNEVVVDNLLENPFEDYTDEILLCTITGQSYPVIQIEDQNGEEVAISPNNAASIAWQRLDEVACNRPLDGTCPTTDDSCSSSWFEIAEGDQYTILEPGEYRVIITFTNTKSNVNTTKIYYFRVEDKVLTTPDFDLEPITIFPNPAINNVTINTQVKMATVFDVTGKRVIQTTDSRFDVSELQSGIYFVGIETNDQRSAIIRLMKN